MAGKLLSLIAGLMEVDESQVDEDSSSDTLAQWDSMRDVELAMLLEQEYGITVETEEIDLLQSVRKVRALLASRGILRVPERRRTRRRHDLRKLPGAVSADDAGPNAFPDAPL